MFKICIPRQWKNLAGLYVYMAWTDFLYINSIHTNIPAIIYSTSKINKFFFFVIQFNKYSINTNDSEVCFVNG